MKKTVLAGLMLLAVSLLSQAGDVLTVKIGEQVRVLKIIDCGNRRGPFVEAQLLYEDLSPPKMPHEKLTRSEQGLPEPHGKPDGRNRMLARRLSGKE